jgi:hypothetical protein
MIRGAQAAEGGLQGAGACSGPRGSPGQHARLWVSRCRLLKRRSSIVRGKSIFLNFQHRTEEFDDPRCAGSGARTPGCRRLLGASGQPGAACAPLGKQMPALEAPVQHRRGEVDFLEFPTPPGELDDPRCAGSGGRTPGCRRLLGASGQPGAACAPLGKQMPALEAPVQHRRGQVDFLEFPTPPGELDDPRCAGSGARTPGCRRLLGASGQPGAACASLGKQMPALEAPVQHRRGQVDFLEFPTPPGRARRSAQAAEGGLQGAGACSGPRGSPGQHARLWVSRCRLLKRRSSIVGGGRFSRISNTPRKSSMIGGAQAAEGGLQGAGACSGPRGSPGQHARLWVSRCRLLKRRSSIVGGRSILSNFQHPLGELNDPRRQRREDSRVQAPARGLGAARGSMRASG